MAKMDALDESWVERKLLTATNTQESVQSLSMWALHHKAQHEKIVAIWFRVLKAAKLELRLTLFYLCNEVVQTCRRRHAVVYKDAFKEVLRDAALLVRDLSIRPNIERIFKIWVERGVYDAQFVDELLILLNNAKVKTAMSTKLLADFTPSKLMDQLNNCAQLEEAVEEQRQALANVDVDALDIDSFKHQLKDRNHGIEYAEELEAACRQIKNYVNNLETEMKERAALVEMLEQSQLYYDAQSSEANMVAIAYRTFGSRVGTVLAKLEERRDLLKSSSSCSSSSTGDAYGKQQYQLDFNDRTPPYSYDGGHDGSEDSNSNSPLEYINPADYTDVRLSDEDIFLFGSENRTPDNSRRLSVTPTKSSHTEPLKRTSSTRLPSPDPFDLFPSEPYRIASATELGNHVSPPEPPVTYMKDRVHRTSSTELAHYVSPTEPHSKERCHMTPSKELAHHLSPTELHSRERGYRTSSTELARQMSPTEPRPRERGQRTPSNELARHVSPPAEPHPRERSHRMSSNELAYHVLPPDPVINSRERSRRTSATELARQMSPAEPAAHFREERVHKTSASEQDHRMSPTERAHLIFHKELSHRRMSSELAHIAEPVHKRSKIESAHYVSPGEISGKHSSKDESGRSRRYSYSSSLSSSPPPRETTPQQSRSKDSIGSEAYVQPSLSFLPRNIASLGSQKQPAPTYPQSSVSPGGATPTRDEEEEEGGATPVLDEPEDDDVHYPSAPPDHSSAKVPANSYANLKRPVNYAGSSDNNVHHHDRQSYSTGSDIGSDVVPSYDKTRLTSQYATNLDRHSVPAPVDKKRPIMVFGNETHDRFQAKAEPYHRLDEQDYHQKSHNPVVGYHPTPGGVPPSSSAPPADVVYQTVMTNDLPPTVTYYPVMEQFSNASYAEQPKPQIYQQPPPDFSVPPPALFNPSFPPPGLSLAPPLPAVSSAGPGPPPVTGGQYALPPPLPAHNNALVIQQSGSLINSQPPPRIVQITVLPSPVDSPLSMFSPPPLPTSSQLPPLPTPTSGYTNQLPAPPRRAEHAARSDFNNAHPPPSGSYISTVSDARRPYAELETTPNQPIRSITSSRRPEHVIQVTAHGARRAGEPASGYGANTRPVLASLSEEHIDHNNDGGGFAGDGGTQQEPMQQIPTLGHNASGNIRVVVDRGQGVFADRRPLRPQAPHQGNFLAERQLRWS